jgi:membrane protein YqaA with SNARE-associated domain
MINECGSVTTGGLTGWWEARFRPSLVTNANKEKKKKKNSSYFYLLFSLLR